MTRRLLAVGVLVTMGALTAPALADDPPQPRRKICVQQATVLPNGYCITWIDPTGPLDR